MFDTAAAYPGDNGISHRPNSLSSPALRIPMTPPLTPIVPVSPGSNLSGSTVVDCMKPPSSCISGEDFDVLFGGEIIKEIHSSKNDGVSYDIASSKSCFCETGFIEESSNNEPSNSLFLSGYSSYGFSTCNTDAFDEIFELCSAKSSANLPILMIPPRGSRNPIASDKTLIYSDTSVSSQWNPSPYSPIDRYISSYEQPEPVSAESSVSQSSQVGLKVPKSKSPYFCTYPNCGKSFEKFQNLKSHVKTHSSDRPYVCECGLSFQRNHDLKRHVKIHEGIRNHVCVYCGKSFFRKDALNRHYKINGGKGCKARVSSTSSNASS